MGPGGFGKAGSRTAERFVAENNLTYREKAEARVNNVLRVFRVGFWGKCYRQVGLTPATAQIRRMVRRSYCSEWMLQR
jgi:hypothetical protein